MLCATLVKLAFIFSCLVLGDFGYISPIDAAQLDESDAIFPKGGYLTCEARICTLQQA